MQLAWGLAMALTKRQKEVLNYLVGFINKNGYSPSFEEIAHALKLTSLATVHKHLSTLEKKGFIRRGLQPEPVDRGGATAEAGARGDSRPARGGTAAGRENRRGPAAGSGRSITRRFRWRILRADRIRSCCR